MADDQPWQSPFGKPKPRAAPADVTDSQKESAVRATFQREAETGGGVRIPIPSRRSSTDDEGAQRVAVTRIDVPITDLVVLLFKLAIASVPVTIVIAIVIEVARIVFYN